MAASRERTAGIMLVTAATVGAGIALVLAFAPPAVDSAKYSYPFRGLGFTLVQIGLFLQHLLLAWGLFTLWRSGVATRRLGAIGAIGSAVGFALLAVLELVAISAGDQVGSTPVTAIFDGLYGMFTILLGVALVLLGVAVVRSRTWRGFARWAPLATGIYVFIVLIPAAAALPHVPWQIVSAVWSLLFALVGFGLLGARRTEREG